MTITVRPPLYFFPNPRPKWWGTNPDAYEVTADVPVILQASFNLYESGVPPPKLPPHRPIRTVGPQKPFRHLHDAPFQKRPPPEWVFINATAALPAVTPPIQNIYDGPQPPPRLPPPVSVGRKNQDLPAAAYTQNSHSGAPKPRALPSPIPVRAAQSAVQIVPSVLAQLQTEFDPIGRPKVYPPEFPLTYSLTLTLVQTTVTSFPRTREYGTKPKWVWPEDAAPTNVAAQPPLIGLAQALDDYAPSGRPEKHWFSDPPLPNIALAPLAVIPPFAYDYPSVKARYWPEDAAAPNVASLPIFSPATAPGFSYDYPATPKRYSTIEPAPQFIEALPTLAIAPAQYYWPALPARKWPGDYFPFTNWIHETPPLPPGLVPPVTFDWPKHLTLTWDDFQPQPGLTTPPIPTYIPNVGYEIYIAYRRFTIATPVRQFALSIPYRAFTVTSKVKGVQTFDVKDPAENWPLSFNMGPDLFSGETLIGPISVTVSLVQGADPNPAAILNGVAGFDQTQTIVVQPVTGGVAGCSYEIVVTCPTTNPQKLLTLVGVLPVQR